MNFSKKINPHQLELASTVKPRELFFLTTLDGLIALCDVKLKSASTGRKF